MVAPSPNGWLQEGLTRTCLECRVAWASPSCSMAYRVLVVNDDGIGAPGLLRLVAALSAAGVAVYVAAPCSERSATGACAARPQRAHPLTTAPAVPRRAGHGITIQTSLLATPIDVPHATQAFSVSGLPADCTMLALGPLFAVSAGVACGRCSRCSH